MRELRSQRQRLRTLGLGVAGALGLLVLFLAAACGGGDGDGDTPTPGDTGPTGSTPAGTAPDAEGLDLSGVVVSSDLAVGPNRFALGIIDNEQNAPILNADVGFRFLKIVGENEAEPRFNADAQNVSFETFFIKESTGEKVTSGDIGVYVANVEFDEAGDWGVEVTGTVEGQEIDPMLLAFQVLEADQTLTIGDPAPRSRQRIESDVEDLTEIETMVPPDGMHDITIADAVGQGKPVVVIFGTPAFCETLTCGPVMQTVMVPLSEKYSDQATFIHVEPYFVEEAREAVGLCPVPSFNAQFAALGQGEGSGQCPIVPEDEIEAAGESWNLTTEPILFIIDGDGNISGKFEGIVGPQEVESALQDLLG
ncbi:MAG: TlpA family protein disulfide reductase [Dehalococcoidia bacterium]